MLKNLKSLFIVEEEAPASEENKAESPKSTPKAVESTSPVAATAPAPAVYAGGIDQVVLEKLLKAIEDNNQSGFDYLEFRRSLKALEQLPIDEATKFKTTFATAATMGVTVEQMLGSIAFYQKVLETEEDNFHKATKNQTNVNIDAKHQERQVLVDLISQKKKTIAQLNEEIAQHEIQMAELSQFIEGAEAKIGETIGKFDGTLNYLKNQMAQDIEKIKQYVV